MHHTVCTTVIMNDFLPSGRNTRKYCNQRYGIPFQKKGYCIKYECIKKYYYYSSLSHGTVRATIYTIAANNRYIMIVYCTYLNHAEGYRKSAVEQSCYVLFEYSRVLRGAQSWFGDCKVQNDYIGTKTSGQIYFEF